MGCKCFLVPLPPSLDPLLLLGFGCLTTDLDGYTDVPHAGAAVHALHAEQNHRSVWFRGIEHLYIHSGTCTAELSDRTSCDTDVLTKKQLYQGPRWFGVVNRHPCSPLRSYY